MAFLRRSKTNGEINSNNSVTTRNVSRINGWSLPLHPLQLLAWFFFLFFAVSLFAFIVPAIPTTLFRGLVVGLNLALFISNFLILIASVTVNPADDNVIERFKRTTQPTVN